MAEELYSPGGGGANLTAAQTVQTQNCVDVTIAGNSTSAGAGYALVSSGTLTLAGGPNITLSQNGNHLTISGGAGGAFSAGVSTDGNTIGTTGTVGNGVLFVGGTNITLEQSSDVGGATITINAPPTTIPQAPFQAGVSNIGNTSGDTKTVDTQIVFVGGNNITLSQSTDVVGATITISQSEAAQTGISGIAGSGASTVTAGTVQFANSNGLTFGLNGSTMTASHDGITSQSVQTQGSVLVNGSSGSIVFAAGNLMSLSTAGSTLTYINLMSSATDIQEVSSASAAGAMVSRFANEGHVHPGVGPAGVSNVGNTVGNTGALMGRMILAGGNNITLSVSTSNNNAQTITISAPNAQTGISGIAGSGASTVTAGTVQFQNSNDMTFGLNGSTMTASFSVTNTIPAIGTAVKAVASVGSTGTITRFAPEDHQHAGVFSIGISAGVGNTSGTTAVLPGRMIFAGGNNITLSQSTAAGNLMTITISQSQPAQTGISGIAGSAASTVTAGTVQFGNANGVSFGLNGSTMTASYTLSSASLFQKFFYIPEGAVTSGQQTNTAASFQRVAVPYNISFSRIDVPILVSLASSATANTGNIVISSGLVLYSLSGAGTLNPIAGAFGTTTHTWASNSANFSNLTGAKFASFPVATTIPMGLYWVGFQMSTTNNSSIGTATTQYANTISIMLGNLYTSSLFADFGGTSSNATLDIGMIGATITATNQTHPIANINPLSASRLGGNFPVLFRNVQ